jgi:hypothetical protein
MYCPEIEEHEQLEYWVQILEEEFEQEAVVTKVEDPPQGENE